MTQKTLEPQSIKINPLQLTDEAQKILQTRIISRSEPEILFPGELYSGDASSNLFPFQIEGDHALIITKKRKGNNHDWAIDVVAVKDNNKQFFSFKSDKEKDEKIIRPVKKYSLILNKENNYEFVEKPSSKISSSGVFKNEEVKKFNAVEVELANKNESLKAKSALRHQNNQFILFKMKNLGQVNLHNILKNRTNLLAAGKPDPLDFKTILTLHIKIIEAYQHDVVKLNCFHRDLKPKNIMVNMTDPIKVNIIDYGLAVRYGTKPYDVSGSLLFMAPEYMQADGPSIETEIYSLGKTLLAFWMDIRLHDIRLSGARQPRPENETKEARYFYQLKDLSHFLENKETYPELDKYLDDKNPESTVVKMIKAMLAPVSTKRPSLDQVLICFKEALLKLDKPSIIQDENRLII